MFAGIQRISIGVNQCGNTSQHRIRVIGGVEKVADPLGLVCLLSGQILALGFPILHPTPTFGFATFVKVSVCLGESVFLSCVLHILTKLSRLHYKANAWESQYGGLLVTREETKTQWISQVSLEGTAQSEHTIWAPKRVIIESYKCLKSPILIFY